MITLEITEDIAEKIRFLAESGVFAINTGNATLNFHEGTLKSIKTELYSYPKVIHTPQFDTLTVHPILK